MVQCITEAISEMLYRNTGEW